MKFALCNEVLQPLPFEQQCASPPRWATTAWRSRRSRWPKTRWTSPTRQAGVFRRMARGPRARDHRAALAAGGAGGSVDRQRRCRVSATRPCGVMQRLVELCALMGGRYLVHGSPKQRTVPAGLHARGGAGSAPRDCFARVASDGARLRRGVLHRAAVHARDRPDQHRGRGGAAGRRDRLARA